MDFFFFIVVILVFVLPGLLRSSKKKRKSINIQEYGHDYHEPHTLDYQTAESLSESEAYQNAQLRELKKRIQSVATHKGTKFGRKQALKATRKLQHENPYLNENTGDDSVSEVSKNAYDANRSRREDWGQRAGPGILSARNLLIIIAGLLIISALGLLPSHLSL